jgi:hypothetical protein
MNTLVINYSHSGDNEKIADELYLLTSRRPIQVIELSINSFLPEDKRNKIKHTFNYRIGPNDMKRFEPILESIVATVKE